MSTPTHTDSDPLTAALLAALRDAVVTEYVEKLPEFMSEPEFAQLCGQSVEALRSLVSEGTLVPAIRDGRRGFRPTDNRSYLARERLLRLPPPRPRPADTRSVQLSEASYEFVWERALRHGQTFEQFLDDLLADQRVQ